VELYAIRSRKEWLEKSKQFDKEYYPKLELQKKKEKGSGLRTQGSGL
jgi:hypothetical protein